MSQPAESETWANDKCVVTLTPTAAFYSSVQNMRPVQIPLERAREIISQQHLTRDDTLAQTKAL